MENKQYSVTEKIAYYKTLIAHAEIAIEEKQWEIAVLKAGITNCSKRLEYLVGKDTKNELKKGTRK